MTENKRPRKKETIPRKEYARISKDVFIDAYIENTLKTNPLPHLKHCVELGIAYSTYRKKRDMYWDEIVEQRNRLIGHLKLVLAGRILREITGTKHIDTDRLELIMKYAGEIKTEKVKVVGGGEGGEVTEAGGTIVNYIDVSKLGKEELEELVNKRLQETRRKNTSKS